MQFKKGMRVVKVFHGIMGYKEVSEEEVERVSKGVVYLKCGEGVTYNAETGKEIENFFPPIWTQIFPKAKYEEISNSKKR